VSAAYRLQIVDRHLGLYDGTWCAPSAFEVQNPFCVQRAVQNIEESGRTTLNSFLGPARPKQIVTLWGTGLGASPGDESTGPVVKNLDIAGLAVLVGGKAARVYYAGRSGCCAGVDEIIFEVPEGIQGCNVPVFVRYAESGLSSNDAFVSMTAGEGACSDERGLSQNEVLKLASGNLTVAQIFVSDPAGQWGAFFGRAGKTYAIPFDTCRTYTWGLPFAAADIASGSYMDAGEALELARDGGTLVALRDQNRVYSGTFDGQLSGTYTLSNRTAGSAIPRFQAPLSIPARTLEWTNREQADSIKRGDDLKFNWSAAGFGAGYVLVGGLFGVDGESSGGFLCRARYENEGFTVPTAVLDRYRAAFPYTTQLDLFVSPAFVQRITISGIDVAEYLQTSVVQTKTLKLE
jgi:hypothetical protein